MAPYGTYFGNERWRGGCLCKVLILSFVSGLLGGHCPKLDRLTGGGAMVRQGKTARTHLFFTFWGEGVLLSGYGEGGLEIANFIEILTG